MKALLALMEARDNFVATGGTLPVNFGWRLECLGRAVLNHAVRKCEPGSAAAKEIYRILDGYAK